MAAKGCDYSIICTCYYVLTSDCLTWHVASLYSFHRSVVNLCAALADILLDAKCHIHAAFARSFICPSSNLTIHVYDIRTNNSNMKPALYARPRVPPPQPESKRVARDRHQKQMPIPSYLSWSVPGVEQKIYNKTTKTKAIKLNNISLLAFFSSHYNHKQCIRIYNSSLRACLDVSIQRDISMINIKYENKTNRKK